MEIKDPKNIKIDIMKIVQREMRLFCKEYPDHFGCIDWVDHESWDECVFALQSVRIADRIIKELVKTSKSEYIIKTGSESASATVQIQVFGLIC